MPTKIAVVGGGPAGLYFSILFKKARPDAEIRVYEKNPEGVTWGWGVVFSEETLGNFRDADPETYDAITGAFARWEAIDVHFRDEVVQSGGHDFAGLRRHKLLDILTARARELGVEVEFGREITDFEALAAEVDLLVGADGINSLVRKHWENRFQPSIERGTAKFIWLGSDKHWDTFTFIIRENEHGLFQVHAYQFEEDTSTFIVECDEASWKNAGLDKATEAESLAYCENLFAPELKGAKLMANRSLWINFNRVKCERWSHENVVIIGDASHTAHFSIGSGTKLAMEDAIVLSQALEDVSSIPEALEEYWNRRWLDVAKLQRAAAVSRRWFEEISRYKDFDPEQFTVSLLSRSKRITHENLRMRDAKYVEAVDRWFAKTQGLDVAPDEPVPPPMFVPFKLKNLELANRVVVSPMCQYSSEDGMPNDWHLVHIGSRAIGGAGLVICEMSNVSAEGRITPACAGLYRDEHIDGWKRVVDFVHENSEAKIGIQLGHAGRKGSVQVPWDGGDATLTEGAWTCVAPSAERYSDAMEVPHELTREEMDAIKADYVRATEIASAAGFDLIEVHMAHGYLLSTFLSPLSNTREDAYGGSLEERMRYPLEIFDAVRAAWPADKPVSVRISATDWADGGLTPQDAVVIARALKEHGCDLIDVSAGGVVDSQEPIYGRMFQTPFSDRIRNEVDIPTIAVGNIQGWDHVNTIVVSGRADLCALARPHLYDPYLTLHAAAEQGWHEHVRWPNQYLAQEAVSARVAEEFETRAGERRKR